MLKRPRLGVKNPMIDCSRRRLANNPQRIAATDDLNLKNIFWVFNIFLWSMKHVFKLHKIEKLEMKAIKFVILNICMKKIIGIQ